MRLNKDENGYWLAIIGIAIIVIVGLVAIYFMFFAEEHRIDGITCSDCDSVIIYEHGTPAPLEFWTWENGYPEIIIDEVETLSVKVRYINLDGNVDSKTYMTVESLDEDVDNIENMSQEDKFRVHKIISCVKRGCST